MRVELINSNLNPLLAVKFPDALVGTSPSLAQRKVG